MLGFAALGSTAVARVVFLGGAATGVPSVRRPVATLEQEERRPIVSAVRLGGTSLRQAGHGEASP